MLYIGACGAVNFDAFELSPCRTREGTTDVTLDSPFAALREVSGVSAARRIGDSITCSCVAEVILILRRRIID